MSLLLESLPPQRFIPDYVEPGVFELEEHPQDSITIPDLTGSKMMEQLLRQGHHLDTNTIELLASMPKPDQETAVKLVKFPLKQLGLIYDYGIWGLSRLEPMLKERGLGFCPDMTGFALAREKSPLIDSLKAVVLTLPIKKHPLHAGYKVGMEKKKGIIHFEAYNYGAFYHHNHVIAQVL